MNRGLVPLGDQLEPGPPFSCNAHLVLEPHVVLNCLAAHAHVIGDLIDVEPLRPPRKHTRSPQPMDRRPFDIG
jgi:hypothetical protein